MLVHYLLAAALAGTGAHDLDGRVQALRSTLATTEAADPHSARVALERGLLASLERRRDLQRVQPVDIDSNAASAAPPAGLLERDDLRRDVQQLDETIEVDTRRLAVLHADRDAAAARLTELLAAKRRLDDGKTSAAPSDIKLELELAESSTAELDALLSIVERQRDAARAQREALARRLAGTPSGLRPTAAEIAEVEGRFSFSAAELEQRLNSAMQAREAAQQARDAANGSATDAHMLTLSEQLTTRDIEVQLVREAQADLTIEQRAWQIALRYWRERNADALTEARERGPALRAMLARRLDFMNASAQLTLTRIDVLRGRIARTADAAALAELRAQLQTLEERLQLVQSALLDQHHTLALIDRLREDFDAGLNAAAFGERLAVAWAGLCRMLGNAWNFELFAVEQLVEVDGRQTAVPRSVTVAKLVEAPLLLVLGLLVAFRLTALIERRARRRGVDEARARLMRRWTRCVLACACAVVSMMLAGIPFAAFAFIGGAVAIGIGFAMQTLLKNLIGGIFVLLERPFRLGDEIQIGELRGIVADIHLRATVVRGGDGSETVVPNSLLVEQNVRSIASTRLRTSRQTLSIEVDAQADAREVIETMRAVALRHGLTHAREPQVFLDHCAADRLHFTLQYWIEMQPGDDHKRVASDLRLMLLGALVAAGIPMAPTVPQGIAHHVSRRAPVRRLAMT